MKKLLIATLLTLSSLSVMADDRWFYVGSMQDNLVYIDRTSIKTDEYGNKQVWTKYLVKKSQIKRLGYSEIKDLTSNDCKSKSYRTLSFIKYGAKGEVIRSWQAEGLGSVTKVVPESIAEGIFDLVCN